MSSAALLAHRVLEVVDVQPIGRWGGARRRSPREVCEDALAASDPKAGRAAVLALLEG